MIGAGAITAEKIRFLSVTVAGDPKEEEVLKYDPERFDSCATINAHDPESLDYPLVTIKMLKIRWPWVRFMQGLRHLCSYTPHLSSFLLLLIIIETQYYSSFTEFQPLILSYLGT